MEPAIGEIEETPANRRRRRILKAMSHVLLALFVYGGLVLAARALHRRVLYQPPKGESAEVPEGATLLSLRADDGAAVHALEFPLPKAERTIVHFHGNAETVEENAALAKMFQRRGFHVVLVEYRGFGRSRGAPPTEAGLYADAKAVLDALAARGVGPERIVLWGQSLGAAVAAEMAAKGRGGRLVLVAPFTSTLDMARRAVPILPPSWVMLDRFDTLAKAPSIAAPALVVHGDIDDVIPLELGERVSDALPRGSLFKVAGGRHDNLYKNLTVLSQIATHAGGS